MLELLYGLDQTDQGREILKTFSKTRKFDALTRDAVTGLNELQELMKLVAR